MLLQSAHNVFIWHAFFICLSYQRQIVSLDEEADNPAFTENWEKSGRVERRASMISYLRRPFCIFIPHSTKIWKSKPESDKLQYSSQKYKRSTVETSEWNVFFRLHFFFSPTKLTVVISLSPSRIKSSDDGFLNLTFFSCHPNCDADDVTGVIVPHKGT